MPRHQNRVRHASIWTACLGPAILVMPSHAFLVPCNPDSDARQVAAALGELSRSVDPCGESAQVAQVLSVLQRCTSQTYRICTKPDLTRNEFDRPVDQHGEPLARL